MEALCIYVEMPREDMVLALWFLDTLSYLDCLPSPAVCFEELSSDCRYPKRLVTRAAKHAALLPTLFITLNEYHPTNVGCCLLCKHVDRNHFYEPNKFQPIVYSSI